MKTLKELFQKQSPFLLIVGPCAIEGEEMAFKIAGSMAIKEGCKQAKPVLLEPVMKVEVVLPEQYLGDIMGDLTSRRSEIQGTEHRKAVSYTHLTLPTKRIV